MTRQSSEAELLFERYLADRGYTFDKEPTIAGTTKRPDWLVHTPWGDLVCEMKSLNPTNTVWSSPIGSRSSTEMLVSQRNAIKEASEQLKPARDLGLALVVVLRSLSPIVQVDLARLAWAMHGDPTVHVSMADDSSQIMAGLNGRLRSNHLYISAVAGLHCRTKANEASEAWAREWIRENDPKGEASPVELIPELMAAASEIEWPSGELLWLETVESLSDQAMSLPREIFDGPRDRRMVATADGTRLEIIR